MILSDVSIRRPVFATILNVILIVFGLISMPRLAIDQYPDVDFPVVTATIVYPGADPESVEQRILDPLEEAVNGIAGLEDVASSAFPNVAQIVLKFKLEKNGDQATQEVRDKIFAALGRLPPEAETPIIQRLDIGSAPIMNVALTASGEIDYGDLSRLAKDVVKPRIERIDGVATANAAGIREREVQVHVSRTRLASFGLTPQNIVQSINQQNLDMPAGRIDNKESYWTLRVKGRLKNADEVSRLPILGPQGVGLRISDVATVKDSIAEEKTAAFVGKKPTILMSIQKQSGANTTSVAEGVVLAIERMQKDLPKNVSLAIVTDNSRFIKGSIDAVKWDLAIGAVLATLIVFVFLRSFWITVISAIALPTAVIATFAFLDTMGFTLNMMSTLGLSLSIGILIDDAIIVIENIARHLSMGKTGSKAAQDATSEIGLAVFATTLTICAVFVPVAFMEGIIGRFFYQFGLTVAFAVLVSLFCAFTIAPMMSSRLLKGGEHKPTNPFLLSLWEKVEGVLTYTDTSYRRVLRWSLDHTKTTIAFGFAMFVFSIVLLRFVPISFFPKEDRSQFNIEYTLPEGTTLETTKAKTFELVEALEAYPGIKTVVSAIGASRDQKPNKARLDVVLVESDLRTYSQDDIMQRLRQDLGPKFATEGRELTVTQAGGGGGGNSEPIQYIFRSDDWQSLVNFTDKVAGFIKANVKGAVDVSTTKPKVQGEYRVIVDSARTADLQISTAQIASTLRALYEGGKVSEVENRGTFSDVNLRIADQDRMSREDLAGITLTNSQGQNVTLGAIARIEENKAPAAIERFGGQRQITVLSNFTGKDLNAAADQINAFLAEQMPPEITYSLSGQTEIMKNAMLAMIKALGLAVLLVYMILCAQYERYIAPLVIMASLPLSLTGAFGSLLITGQAMSVYTMIGIILLMGLVTKNGILVIDFTLQRIHEGLSPRDALLEAGPIRLRPILMTTFAAGGGMLPVAIGHGVGGEAKSPMGVAVIGGLLVSTLLTLVVVPCLFLMVENFRHKISALRQERLMRKKRGSLKIRKVGT